MLTGHWEVNVIALVHGLVPQPVNQLRGLARPMWCEGGVLVWVLSLFNPGQPPKSSPILSPVRQM